MMIRNSKEEGGVCTVPLRTIRKSPTFSESRLPAILNWKKHKSIPGFTPSLSRQNATKQCRDSNPSQWHQQKKTLPFVPPQPRSNWHLGATKKHLVRRLSMILNFHAFLDLNIIFFFCLENLWLLWDACFVFCWCRCPKKISLHQTSWNRSTLQL